MSCASPLRPTHALHIARAVLKNGDSRIDYLPTAPYYTVSVSAAATKLQRLGVTAHSIAGHVIAHHVGPTRSDPRPRFVPPETRMGGNQVDVSLGPWLLNRVLGIQYLDPWRACTLFLLLRRLSPEGTVSTRLTHDLGCNWTDRVSPQSTLILWDHRSTATSDTLASSSSTTNVVR